MSNTTTETCGNRKDTLPIKVFCNPAERQAIVAKAGQCGLSASNFLRNVGLGIGIVSAVYYQKIDELLRINGDLGLLGGLLKRWLQNGLGVSALRRLSLEHFKFRFISSKLLAD